MIYKFPEYYWMIAAAVSFVAAIIAVFLLINRANIRFTLIAGFLALLGAVVVAPMLALDTVILDGEKLEQTTGFWFAPTVKGFRHADVAAISFDTVTGRKGRQSRVWRVQFKDGHTEEIDPGDLWEVNEPDILPRLSAMGIHISGGQ